MGLFFIHQALNVQGEKKRLFLFVQMLSLDTSAGYPGLEFGDKL
jgi:hypothetical protein